MEAPRTDAPAPPSARTRAERLSGPALWIALAVLAAWCVFIVYLAGRSSTEATSEIQWTRLAWLFSSAEAVVFAAAGALFGTSVQRQRAERAERQADENARDAGNGRALAQALLADEGSAEEPEAGEATPGVRTRGAEPGARAAPAGTSGAARRHAHLARTFFPGLR